MYFFALLAGGIVFLLLAFLFFLPVIILSPSKFALSFTLGCMLILAGFAQLRGWQQQLKHMLSRERLPFSSGGCACPQPCSCGSCKMQQLVPAAQA